MKELLHIRGTLVGSIRLCKGNGYTEIDTYQDGKDFYNVTHVEDRNGHFHIDIMKDDKPTVTKESVNLIEHKIL